MKGGSNKKQKVEAMNEANDEESMQVEEVTFMTEEDHDLLMNFSDENHLFDQTDDHVLNTNGNEESLIYYDWIADSATMSHISNKKEAFVMYKPLTGKAVAGVGNKQANVEGKGTIELESTYKGNKYLLRLDDVLYVPGNQNNLISLG